MIFLYKDISENGPKFEKGSRHLGVKIKKLHTKVNIESFELPVLLAQGTWRQAAVRGKIGPRTLHQVVLLSDPGPVLGRDGCTCTTPLPHKIRAAACIASIFHGFPHMTRPED